MLTRVTVELSDSDESGGPFMASLRVALETYCGDLHCSVRRKTDFVIVDSFAETLASAVDSAQQELLEDPALGFCAYLAPRTIVLPEKRKKARVSSTIIVMCTREKIVQIGIEAVTEARTIPAAIMASLQSSVTKMRERAMGVATPDEHQLIVRILHGIREGHMLAVELMTAPEKTELRN